MRKRREYTEEEKTELLNKVEGHNITVVSRELGISKTNIYRWRQERGEREESKIKEEKQESKNSIIYLLQLQERLTSTREELLDTASELDELLGQMQVLEALEKVLVRISKANKRAEAALADANRYRQQLIDRATIVYGQ